MSEASSPSELTRRAAARLAHSGIESPEHDATVLLAHVLGTTRGQLPLIKPPSAVDAARFEALVGQRATRIPLQHLIGSAPFRHVELAVGPGVFIPRPETELLAGWAIERARDAGAQSQKGEPIVVDLCTGSGAIAAAIADEVPEAQVHAVELDSLAHEWAERNLVETSVDLRLGDMATAFDDLDGQVDVLTCNPPYIPLTEWEGVSAEARDHDPALALWSGADGLDAIRVLESVAARLLRHNGWVGCEHADLQGEAAPAVFLGAGRWIDVRDHQDLAGRPRYLTARLAR